MSQPISPVKWLESALFLLGVWDIFEQTTCEVVNNEVVNYGRVILPLTSSLGTIKIYTKTLCGMDDRCRTREAPSSIPCCIVYNYLSELATICLISRI
jgi:hypothetical protein